MSSAVKQRIGAINRADGGDDGVDDHLCGAAARRVGGVGVEPVLEHVEVERRQVGGDVVDQRAVDVVELEVVVGGSNPRDQIAEHGEGVAIEIRELGLVEAVGRRIEAR